MKKILLFGVLISVGCAHRGGYQDQIVEDIAFTGNGGALSGTSDFNLRTAMLQRESRSFAFLAPQQRYELLDRSTLQTDAWRIETWYAHHGYFDAQFEGWEITTQTPPNQRRNKPEMVRITGSVNPGEATIMASPSHLPNTDAVAWHGLEVMHGGARPILARLKRSAPLQEGDQFTLAALRSTEEMTLAFLKEMSFARVQTDVQVDVWPEEHSAHASLNVDLGPSCTFGPTLVSGNFGIDLEIIRAEFAHKEGDPYKESRLAQTKKNLFDLGIFSVIDINAVHDEDSDPSIIPISIQLTERNDEQLKIGGGFQLDSGKQDVHGSANYDHANVANRLYRFNIANQWGYTVLSNFSVATFTDLLFRTLDEDPIVIDHGFTGVSEMSLTLPRVPARDLESSLDVSFTRVLEDAYTYMSPTLSPSIAWSPSKPLDLDLSYTFSYVLFGDYTSEGVDLDALHQDDTINSYYLSMLQQQLTVDTRSDPLDPKRGGYGIFRIAESGGVLGGEHNFIRLQAEQRRYFSLSRLGHVRLRSSDRTIRRWLVDSLPFLPEMWRPQSTFAGRVEMGWIHTYGDESERIVPYPERFYLGGSNNVRGWSRNHLGPYVCTTDDEVIDGAQSISQGTTVTLPNQPNANTGFGCESENGYASGTDTITPVGGTYSMSMGIEWRRYWQNTYGVAVFADMGMVWWDTEAFLDSWNRFADNWPRQREEDRLLARTIGAGVRYRTPLGPLRFDVGYRFDDHARFHAQPSIQIHLALGETY